ncbi:hypothetical protein J3458_012669 [Metarhizium acridum]|uniref:uncharacterized protein n=1 Tax=Metarhizium acridum TaxID=92637 RepID=UPI001C6D1111|nr:hypothetical protein J3458_012669 [Metarhizium acridum]
MYCLGKAAVMALGLVASSRALEAVILADTNRDGKLDIKSDAEGKRTWTEDRGALFMANIADTDRRCSETIKDDTPFPELDKCNDASDNILRNSKFLAPLQTLPNSGLTDAAQGLVTVSGEFANEKVRIFHKIGNDWAYVEDSRVFKAAELRAGLELGMDARDVRRPNEWDGRVKVYFNLTDNGESAADYVELRVAPVLIHHHLQELTEVYVASLDRESVGTKQFSDFVEKYTAEAGIKAPVVKFKSVADRWAQDIFETGYTSILGPDGPVVLRIMVRSSQVAGDWNRQKSGRKVFSQLRSAEVGAVQHLPPTKKDRPWGIDSLGNLETVPPHSHNGKNYPNGRAVMGSQNKQKPHLVAFLEAQEAQPPIELDTSFLKVGHVDEFMQFLPANNARGWVMVVDDPKAALDMFRKAQQDGFGKTPAMSRPHMSYDTEFLTGDYMYSCLPSDSIDDLLRIWNFEPKNMHAAEQIQLNIDIMKRETGITDEDIVRIPALYFRYDGGWNCRRKKYWSPSSKRSELDGKPEVVPPFEPEVMPAFGSEEVDSQLGRRAVDNQLVAFHPAVINGVVYNNGKYLAPNPWGPVINGSDILAAASNEQYGKLGFEVTYMDDWFDHHKHAGETHCGTNVARDASKKWW